VFIRTSPFRPQDAQCSRSACLPLPVPTSDSAHISQAANALLQRIYEPGYRYAKAGVMLMGLQPATRQQRTLDLSRHPGDAQPANRTRLMQAMDQINVRHGRGSLKLGSAGMGQARPIWQMKQEFKTAAYTTDWAHLLLVQMDAGLAAPQWP
jgi:DNA polymerase V